MPIRRFQTSLLPTVLLAVTACLGMSPGIAHAQVSNRDLMQSDPPPPLRYRKPRKTFTVSADPTSKPLPIPPMIQPPPPQPTPSQLPPTQAELDKKEARKQAKQQQQIAEDQSHDRLVNIGKVLGFLVVVGVGIFAVSDIARQVRKAKQAPPEDDYSDEDEDL